MIDVRRAAGRYRGGDAAAGIDTRHAFSFSGHYDPDNVRFGLLLACNEERLAPGSGFAEHAHRDTEIVTWVIEGELTHADAESGVTVLGAGGAQVLSAGGGVRHVERNSGAEPLRFLQMWLHPATFGAPAAYRAAPAPAPPGPGVTLLASAGPGSPLPLRQPAATLWLARGPSPTPLPPAPFGYVHVLAGGLVLAGRTLVEGDAARLTGEEPPRATEGAEFLYWAMEGEPTYG